MVLLSLRHVSNYNCQSIWAKSCSFNHLLAFEKCLHPKNPLLAESGLGWAAFNRQCLEGLILLAFFCDGNPHNIKTTPCLDLVFTASIIISVNASQPFFWWLFAVPPLTVSTVLSKSTPCCAHLVKSPCFGTVNFTSGSSLNSLYIFFKLGGGVVPGGTEKLNPIACPGLK